MGTSVVEWDDLPEPIIQRIQSFLDSNEASQTTLLSKSWRRAWLTRPNLAFIKRYPDKVYWELARKTIRRYKESNLKIQSLTLRVGDHFRQTAGFVHWNELIAKSMKLGATHLYLELVHEFVLHHGLVFGSEKLVGLSVERCKIEKGSSDRKVIRCSGLESLSLSSTHISPDLLSNIISSCPSIQKLSLSSIYWLVDEEEGVNRSVGLGLCWLVDEEEGVNRPVGLGLMNLHSLTRLELDYVIFDTLFLGDMSSRFPNLKDLKLHTCSTSTSQDKKIRISSRSLECLNFALVKGHSYPKWRIKFKFHVPNIRRFTYKGRVVPLLSFKSTSREWESRVSIERYKNPDSLWLRRLNKFLTKLRRSQIHLSLKVGCGMSFDYEAGEIQGLRRRAQVENLTVDVGTLPTVSCYPLFDGLFLLCCPKLITQYLHPADHSRVQGMANREYFLCKAFLARMGGNERHFLYNGLRDLEEVNAELFDKEMSVWRHVPLKSLLDDASTNCTTDEQKIRFQLKWKR